MAIIHFSSKIVFLPNFLSFLLFSLCQSTFLGMLLKTGCISHHCWFPSSSYIDSSQRLRVSHLLVFTLWPSVTSFSSFLIRKLPKMFFSILYVSRFLFLEQMLVTIDCCWFQTISSKLSSLLWSRTYFFYMLTATPVWDVQECKHTALHHPDH